MIYAYIVETIEQGETGYNLDILDHKYVDIKTGIDFERTIGAEDEIRMKFEIEEEKKTFTKYQLLWWLGKNNFSAVGNNEYQIADDNIQ